MKHTLDSNDKARNLIQRLMTNRAISDTRISRRAKAISTSLALALLVGCGAANSAPPNLAGCQILPTNNVWNTPIDTLPVHASSNAWVNTIGTTTKLHPDWGITETVYGIPFTTVTSAQPKVPISFTVPDESDPGPYPIPANAPIEGGPNGTGDRHILVIETTNCILYETGNAYLQGDGFSWKGYAGAIWNLKSNALRTPDWTSADAAGLPIFPGLVRWEEVAAGEINHALRFTVPSTRRGIYQWPATHWATNLADNVNNPMMGARFRLKASFDISGFNPNTQVILRALKKYGMLLADNGSPWYISGMSNVNWPSAVLSDIKSINGGNFEAVDVTSMIVNINSGEAKSATTPPPGPAKPFDLSGDGNADLLFRNSADGTTNAWLMNGLTTASSANIRAADASWSVTHIADFNGDGKADILWRKTDGTVALWLMDGLSVLANVTLLGANPDWSVSHVADFDGNGKADLLWRNTNGAVTIWLMNGTSVASAAGILGADANWRVSHVADFNGDGKVDLLWRNTNGAVTTWLMNGTSITGSAGILGPDPNWSVSHVADFNGDGKADLLWRNTNGAVTTWLMNGTSIAGSAGILGPDPNWSVSHVADFNGDGKADILWRNNNGAATMWLMNGVAISSSAGILGADPNWRVSHTIDLNGDGKSDLIWRRTDGSISAWLMNGTSATSTAGLRGPGTWQVVPPSL
jgi:FG-GAP-like repeat